MSHWDNKTAEWYAEKYGEYATNQLGLKQLQFKADMTLVDIGCGTGSALRHASKHIHLGRLIGVDPIPRMLEIAKTKTLGHAAETRIEYLEGSAEALPLTDALADLVLAFDSYDHWQNKAKGLQEVQRILKERGQFVIVKDGGLPGGQAAREKFETEMHQAGFRIAETHTYAQNAVECTQWICLLN